MKQIFSTPKGNIALDAPMPTPGDKELLVAVYSSAISTGTETMDMKKDDLSFSEKIHEKKVLLDKVFKSIHENGLMKTFESVIDKISPAEQSIVFRSIGYSNAGIVVAKGQLVSGFNVGDRVACAGAGFASHAEYTVVPVNLAVKFPNAVGFDSACYAAIGAISMQGIRRAGVTFGETVVITGLGLLGLLAVQIAKAWGLVVIGTDINPGRFELAKELGADHCFDANDKDLVQKINNVTNGVGADAIIIYAATKSSEPANRALDACRRKGRVVIVGSVGMDLQREAMYSKELDFVMSTSYGPGRYDNQYEVKGIDYPIGYVRWTENRNMMEFVRLLSTGQVKIDSLISNRFNIDQGIEAYRTLVDNSHEAISCIFNYSHEAKEVPVSRLELSPSKRIRGKIGVGIIGAGGFIQNNHLANILRMPEDYELVAIAEKTTASAKAISEKYGVKYVTTDYRQLLNDPDIDLIIIGTRHNLHAIQIVDSIKAGKNVLVEKPLAMNNNELLMIEQAIEENPTVIAAVGFNRRYSPLIQKVKAVISERTTPVVINYRVNAGFISSENWVQDLEEGGGRIIGEVCHFIDLIAYLTSGRVVELDVIHIPCDGIALKSEDNIIVILKFDNESIGVLTYTSIGGKGMEKERIEIFYNRSSFVIRDFAELSTFSCDFGNIKLKEMDKGHKALIKELNKKLKNVESLILPFKTDIEMTRFTLEVVDKIHRIKQS